MDKHIGWLLLLTVASLVLAAYLYVHPVNCCAGVSDQLAVVTECIDFIVVDNEGCGEPTQHLIDTRLVDLGCSAWDTDPPPFIRVGGTWTVTMRQDVDPLCANVTGQLAALAVSCEPGTYIATITDCTCQRTAALICDWELAAGCVSLVSIEPPEADSCLWTIEYTTPD